MSRDKIAESLGVRKDDEIELEAECEEELLPEVVEESPSEVIEDEEIHQDEYTKQNLEDLELARSNIQNIINVGDDSLKDMIDLAKQSESPRAFEVASTLMKTLLDANKEFIDVSTKKKDTIEKTKNSQGGGNTTNVTNNNLILSTTDLLKKLKGDE